MNLNSQGLESQPRDENGKLISFDGTGDFGMIKYRKLGKGCGIRSSIQTEIIRMVYQ